MKYKYHDSDPLHAIEKGYNEKTRFLMFHSTPISADKLQDALDIIGSYNEFDSKLVGETLLAEFGDYCRFIVGREYSVVVYVEPIQPCLFWKDTLDEIALKAKIDEVAVTHNGRLRLWWD